MLGDRKTHLPAVANAKLPQTYEAAKLAIAECERVDECAEWADRMVALASYARQVEDKTMEEAATKIRCRAVRRCGELLKQIKKSQGGRPKTNGKLVGAPPPVSRTQAARDAGLSKDQQMTATRVAAIPKAEFEAAIESGKAPTVSELAARGTRSKPVDDGLNGRDPADFKAAGEVIGQLECLAKFCRSRVNLEAVQRGLSERELAHVLKDAAVIARWLEQFTKRMGG